MAAKADRGKSPPPVAAETSLPAKAFDKACNSTASIAAGVMNCGARQAGTAVIEP
ncbi:hypothetical protein [Pseudomonas sp. C32]|uniref:hypothetical protein n=1 Tax=Pseudomonas sp. C32 TaxID=1529208 RepID=UPI00262B1D49|nr:hypothetical protein [Pseudomonas sp. C32]MDN4545616.1 hypothetical protein [Pseudomonas sp. C32]